MDCFRTARRMLHMQKRGTHCASICPLAPTRFKRLFGSKPALLERLQPSSPPKRGGPRFAFYSWISSQHTTLPSLRIYDTVVAGVNQAPALLFLCFFSLPFGAKCLILFFEQHALVLRRMTTTDKGYLNTLCGNRPHQGFILKARPLQFEPILFLPRIDDNDGDTTTKTPTAVAAAAGATTTTTTTTSGDEEEEEDEEAAEENAAAAAALKKPPAPLAAAATGQVWLALDEVTDPQNFGALLRSAHFFGASGVVACAKNSASLTATVSKSSAGAVEVMRVHSTANMMRFLKRSRENGWRVVGTSVSERSGPLHELPAGPGAPPTIVVLGNEGYGVRANVLRECEFLVEVAGDGGGAVVEGAKASTVDSLNVSVTGGVVLFHLLAGAKHAAAYKEPSPAAADTAASSQ